MLKTIRWQIMVLSQYFWFNCAHVVIMLCATAVPSLACTSEKAALARFQSIYMEEKTRWSSSLNRESNSLADASGGLGTYLLEEIPKGSRLRQASKWTEQPDKVNNMPARWGGRVWRAGTAKQLQGLSLNSVDLWENSWAYFGMLKAVQAGLRTEGFNFWTGQITSGWVGFGSVNVFSEEELSVLLLGSWGTLLLIRRLTPFTRNWTGR